MVTSLIRGVARRLRMAVRVVLGRTYYTYIDEPPMKGAYPSYDAAMSSQPPRQMVGYDHDEIVPDKVETMSSVLPWDYPILFWLQRILPNVDRMIDAGGHVGAKYRAFQTLMPLPSSFDWIVLDLPATVAEGRRLAAAEGLQNLRFETDPEKLPPAKVLLASGLLQYYPHSLSTLLRQLKEMPEHLLVNKVALRDGPAFFTMQQVGPSRVPYQVRNRDVFLRDVAALGYEIVDRWDIPGLYHTIATHPELGQSESYGFYFRRGAK